MKQTQQQQAVEHEDETEAALSLSENDDGSVSTSNNVMTILDMKDDIIQDNVCSFLDRESICEIIKKQTTLTKHFQLYKHFCISHGSRLSIVSKEKRKEFKCRKKAQIADNDDAVHLIVDHPGCIDCSMGMDGRLRCKECQSFEHWEDFGQCHECNRTACQECLPLVYCEECHGETCCRDCFDGFQCCECGENYCNDCEILFVCANETCSKAACTSCSLWAGLLECDKCLRPYCDDCCDKYVCDVCDEIHCAECATEGTVSDEHTTSYRCIDCAE